MKPLSICHNLLLAIGCLCVAAVGITSIITGHDGLELCLATIAALSGVVPPVVSKFSPPEPSTP